MRAWGGDPGNCIVFFNSQCAAKCDKQCFREGASQTLMNIPIHSDLVKRSDADSDLRGLQEAPGCCISNRYQGNAESAAPGPCLE